MKPWNKKHYVIPSEYNERGNPQNKNFFSGCSRQPFGLPLHDTELLDSRERRFRPHGEGNHEVVAGVFWIISNVERLEINPLPSLTALPHTGGEP